MVGHHRVAASDPFSPRLLVGKVGDFSWVLSPPLVVIEPRTVTRTTRHQHYLALPQLGR